MKVEIIKAVNATGKIWDVGATPSVTAELYARLLKGGYCKPLNGDEAPTNEPTPEPETKAEEKATEPKPRPTRKPRKTRK